MKLIISAIIGIFFLLTSSAQAQVNPRCTQMQILGSVLGAANPVPVSQFAIAKFSGTNQIAFSFFGDALAQVSSTISQPGSVLATCDIQRSSAGYNISMSYLSDLYFGSVLAGTYNFYVLIQATSSLTVSTVTLVLDLGTTSITYTLPLAAPSFMRLSF